MVKIATCPQHKLTFDPCRSLGELVAIPHHRSNRFSHILSNNIAPKGFKLYDSSSNCIPPEFKNQVLAKPYIKKAGPVVFMETFNTSYDPTPYLAIDHLSDACSKVDSDREIYRIQINYSQTDCKINLFKRTSNGWKNIISENFDLIAMTENAEHYLKFTKIIEDLAPSVLAITTDSKVHSMARNFLRQAKNKLNESLVVLGGIHANNALESIVSFEAEEMYPMFDMIHTGKIGQSDFKAIIKSINSSDTHSRLAKLSNFTVLAQDQTYLGLDTPWYISNPDLLQPITDVSLGSPATQMPAYWFGEQMPIFRIKTAWGCQFSCEFCATSGSYTTGNLTEVNNFFESLAMWSKKNGKSQDSIMVYLEDANFSGQHSRKVLEITSKYRFKIGIQARFDTFKSSSNHPIKHDLIELMSKGNISYIFFGLESVNQQMRDSYGKNNGLGTRDMYEILSELNSRNISYLTSCIVGTLGETEQDIVRTIAFARLTGAEVVSVELPKIYPNTGLARLSQMNVSELYTRGASPYTSKDSHCLTVGWNVGFENLGCLLSSHLTREKSEQIMSFVDKLMKVDLSKLLQIASFELSPIRINKYFSRENDLGFYHS